MVGCAIDALRHIEENQLLQAVEEKPVLLNTYTVMQIADCYYLKCIEMPDARVRGIDVQNMKSCPKQNNPPVSFIDINVES